MLHETDWGGDLEVDQCGLMQWCRLGAQSWFGCGAVTGPSLINDSAQTPAGLEAIAARPGPERAVVIM